MPGIDKPTGRVVALIVLLLVVAAALRGYLPAPARATRTEPGSSRAALMIVIIALSATVGLMAVAIFARLRDPRPAAPHPEDLSEMLGTGMGRPSWRVLLIGLGVIAAWLLIAMLLARFLVAHGVTPPARAPDTTAPRPPGTAAPQQQQPQQPHNNSGTVLGILLVSSALTLLMIVTGTVIMARRRRRAAASAPIADDYVESLPPPIRSESLVRAAELGLAEAGDLSREPREAIISCYAAMERGLANVPGAVPQDFDTPTEVLVRAVERRALHADNAVQLVNLFEEARFSPHVMNEEHREVAVEVLRLVLAELRRAA